MSQSSSSSSWVQAKAKAAADADKSAKENFPPISPRNSRKKRKKIDDLIAAAAANPSKMVDLTQGEDLGDYSENSPSEDDDDEASFTGDPTGEFCCSVCGSVWELTSNLQ